jgi:hypothetical protein
MRTPSGTASRSLLVFLAALLASCSNASQVLQTTPDGMEAGVDSGASRSSAAILLKKRPTPLEVLKLQAAGKLPAAVPLAVVRRQLEQFEHPSHHRLRLPHDAGSVAMWATTYLDGGTLIGLNATGKKLVAAIDEGDVCSLPTTVKVDGSRNVWSSCLIDNDVAEFSKAGVLKKRYDGGCPAPVSACEAFVGESFDESANSQDVFSALAFYELETSSGTTTGGGFEWWPASSPSATPTLIALPSDDPVQEVEYMDLDTSGNIWFDYYGCSGTSCGYGLAEITKPTKEPTMVSILPVGSIEEAGGVYVSDHGKVLNVTDQETRITEQYKLPLAPSGKPFNKLGPTRADALGLGDPVSGGFNQTETKLAFGDADGWLDLGNVAANTWKDVQNISFWLPEGAAYTPSDR